MKRPRPRVLLVTAAALAVALLAAGCNYYKEGSFSVSQPGGVGPLRMQLAICSTDESGCGPNEDDVQAQMIVAFLVPKGAAAPASVTAAPGPGATPIVFNQDPSIAATLLALSEPGAFPPSGTEIVGYLSEVRSEKVGENLEWTLAADFGLPAAADGGSLAAPTVTQLVFGWRVVDATHPATRPVNCLEGNPEKGEATSICSAVTEPLAYGYTDLRIAGPSAPLPIFPGGSGKLAFSFDLASSAPPPPSFTLRGKTTLAKGKVSFSQASFQPGPLAAGTNRAPLAQRTAKVFVPAGAKPGTYPVTVEAIAAAGGRIKATASVRVIRANLGLRTKLNRAQGTATLWVKVPGAGRLTLGGKGVATAQRQLKRAATVRLTVRAKGAAKRALARDGVTAVTAKLKFKPTSGSAAFKLKPLTLRR